ncbi:metal-dependent hydrolase [Gracilimonas mengyeensis]|uniref:Inner membrane protein n=1 Tax=Gracilimonas mengyeensis TaxID=1302730 RepID=A0A521DWN9_9BACT|nr:metal-dependent hydrolase [Gracilimonas mengyeensis]SMO76117.1 inner membrane protein [Gracilimonas mengyeensis]
MDPVTHGLIGATASQSFAKKNSFRAAALVGLASAMLADVDVFISSASDPLLNLEMHRQFTHSLFFIPVGALVASLLCYWLVKKYLSFPQTYLYSLAGYATAGLMDYFTSYGVQLFWPFTDTRYSLDIISVFDPLFTLGVILLAGISFYKKEKIYSWLALAWAMLYLIFGFTQKQKAVEIAQRIANNKNHEIQELVAKPTIANQIVWGIRYVADDTLHASGVRLAPFSDSIIYEGERTKLLNWQEEFSEYKGITLYNDIQRFSELSGSILIKHPDYENVLGDGRYSMLPTTLSPLWGIKIDTTRPAQHVDFGTYRDANPQVRQRFMDMLLGRKLK